MSIYTVSYQMMMTVNGPQLVAVGGFTEVQTFARLNPGFAGDDARQSVTDLSFGFERFGLSR
jgi:hypothetical protein